MGIVGDHRVKVAGSNVAQHRFIRLHPQAVIDEVKVDIQSGQRRPVRLEGESRVLQRYRDLELAFVMLIGELMWVAAVNQGGIACLAALNCAAQVIHQRFAHQIFREIAPRLAAIIGTDTRQDA